MQVSSAANVAALGKLIDRSSQVQAQVQISVLKQALEGNAAAMIKLMASLDPNLGQQVDIRI